MRVGKFLKKTLLASALIAAGLTAAPASASAYVVCNRHGDCWHADRRVHFPGVRLIFHGDSWWDRHRDNHRYVWHDLDRDHDWHRGYWDHGAWHRI
jgi:hypothetical protein